MPEATTAASGGGAAADDDSSRTGTRLNIGQPQPRWAAGVDLASVVLGGLSDSQSSSHALSIGSRIREAASIVAQFFAGSLAPT